MAAIVRDIRGSQLLLTAARTTSDKLTINVQRDIVINTIQRDGQDINQLSQATNTVNIVEKNGRIVRVIDNNGNTVNIVQAQNTFTFLQCRDSMSQGCYGGDGKLDEPLDHVSFKPKQSPSFTRFSSLPQELQDLILDKVVGPHTVTAYKSRKTVTKVFLVEMDRTWTDIALYHVCHRFRQLAIKRFGVPKQGLFPFDSENDVLFLHQVTYDRIRCLRRRSRQAEHPVAMFNPSPSHVELELWHRIKIVETEARSSSEINADSDCRMFRKLHTWRILVLHFDTRRITHAPDQPIYNKRDLFTRVKALVCLTGYPPDSWRPKVIEICRKGGVCSNVEEVTWRTSRCTTETILMDRAWLSDVDIQDIEGFYAKIPTL